MPKLSHAGLLLTLLLLINNSYYISVFPFNPDSRMHTNGRCLCTGTDFVTSADPEGCIINFIFCRSSIYHKCVSAGTGTFCRSYTVVCLTSNPRYIVIYIISPDFFSSLFVGIGTDTGSDPLLLSEKFYNSVFLPTYRYIVIFFYLHIYSLYVASFLLAGTGTDTGIDLCLLLDNNALYFVFFIFAGTGTYTGIDLCLLLDNNYDSIFYKELRW
jgi:hypothetical protein